MKKIITILFLFIGFIAKSQVVVERSPKSVIPEDRNLFTTFNFKFPVFADTTAANAMMFKDSLGLCIETMSPAALYIRTLSTGTVHKWTILATTPASPIWGLITGTLSSQLDLQAALNAKQNLISLGTTAQYFRGDLSLATFPTDLSSFTNGPGYLTGVNVTNSITGTGSVATPLKLVNDAASPGALKYYGTDNGGVRGWQNTTGDTVYVTQIGTGSPQIPLLYAVNGNLRTARLVPGLFTIPFINADSGVGVNADTTSLATWAGITSRGIGGNIYNIDGTLTANRTVTTDGFNLIFTQAGANKEFQFLQTNGSSIVNTEIFPTVWQTTVSDGTTLNTVNWQAGQMNFSSAQGSKFNQFIIAPDSVSLAATNGTTVKLSLTNTTARLKGLPSANDTSARKPVAIGTDGTLVVMDGWAGSGGGVPTDVVTTITSGTSSTVPNGTNIIRFNPTGVLTYTLTLPTTWHTSNDLLIAFTSNGTIGNGSLMVNLTVVNGSGHTLSYNVNPTASYNAGEILRFHLISTIEQRTN